MTKEQYLILIKGARTEKELMEIGMKQLFDRTITLSDSLELITAMNNRRTELTGEALEPLVLTKLTASLYNAKTQDEVNEAVANFDPQSSTEASLGSEIVLTFGKSEQGSRWNLIEASMYAAKKRGLIP